MAALVSRAAYKARAGIDFDDDDADIDAALEQATDIVIDYIKRPEHGWTESTVPYRVVAAIIIVTTALREDQAKGDVLSGLSGGDLKNPLVALLHRLRDPALA